MIDALLSFVAGVVGGIWLSRKSIARATREVERARDALRFQRHLAQALLRDQFAEQWMHTGVDQAVQGALLGDPDEVEKST